MAGSEAFERSFVRHAQGVFCGTTLFSWATFMEIRNMGDRHKRAIGFDNFGGFGGLDAKDGAARRDHERCRTSAR